MGRGDYTIENKQKIRQRKLKVRLKRIATDLRKARAKAKRK